MKYTLRNLMTFSIRDLVWLPVVVALGVAWWMERTRAERLAKEAEVMEAAEAIILAPLSPRRGEGLGVRGFHEQGPL